MPPPSVHLQITAPSRWVARFSALIPTDGRVLDVACGGGRHSRMLLDSGRRVTCIDKDTAYVADLQDRAEVLTADLEDGSRWPLGERVFDAVIVTNYLYRPLFPALLASVAPGGLLLYETFALGNEQFGRPRNPDHLLRPGELLEVVGPHLQVVAYEAGEEDRGTCPRVIERICAVRSDTPVMLPAAL